MYICVYIPKKCLLFAFTYLIKYVVTWVRNVSYQIN